MATKKLSQEEADELLVHVWNRSESARQAAEELGRPVVPLTKRVWQLRALGVPLKLMPKGRRPPDVARLTQIAKKAAM